MIEQPSVIKLFIAGQVGWDENQQFKSSELMPQVDQALKNIADILETADCNYEHLISLRFYCKDLKCLKYNKQYLYRSLKSEIGQGNLSQVFIGVSDLLGKKSLVEIEANAEIDSTVETGDRP